MINGFVNGNISKAAVILEHYIENNDAPIEVKCAASEIIGFIEGVLLINEERID